MRPRRAAIALLALTGVAGAVVGGTSAAFNGNAGSTLAIDTAPDWTPPTASPVAIVKSSGGEAGYIRQGGSYYVYATVSDTGNPSAGVASASANASTITTGVTAAALTAGSYTVGGVTYNWRSALTTANATLTAGSKAFTVAATDGAANTAASAGSGSVTVDNTVPAASAIATANVGGGTARRPQLNDSITFTYNDTVDATTVLAGWTGAQQNVVLRIVDGGGGNDRLQVWNAANTTQLPLTNAAGVDLGRADYVTATTTFGATGTASRMTRTNGVIAILLGTPAGTVATAGGNGTMAWTPSATVTDRAGNACTTTVLNETGTADGEF